MIKVRDRQIRGLACSILVCCAPVALADTEMSLSFERLTFNMSDADALADQFTVQVGELGDGRVQFSFFNTGSYSAAITGIYWDESTSDLVDYASVGLPSDWSEGAYPIRLPGTTNDTFPVAFSAEVNVSMHSTGVLPGEGIAFTFDLASGASFADLAGAIDSGDLSLGIYVQGTQGGFTGGGAGVNRLGIPGSGDSFVANGTRLLVPIPASVGLGLLGIACIAFLHGAKRKAR